MNVQLRGFSYRADYLSPVSINYVFYPKRPVSVISFRIIKTI